MQVQVFVRCSFQTAYKCSTADLVYGTLPSVLLCCCAPSGVLDGADNHLVYTFCTSTTPLLKCPTQTLYVVSKTHFILHMYLCFLSTYEYPK